jgi:hypothetical protein
VKPEDVRIYYGTAYKFEKITKMSANTLRNWIKWDFVPENAQYKLERMTKGALKTEWTDK